MDSDGLDFETYVKTRSNALMRYGYVLTGNAHDAADLPPRAPALPAPAGAAADRPRGCLREP